MGARYNFVVVGSARALVIQVMLAIRTFSNAECLAVCSKKTQFLRYSNLPSRYVEIDFDGADDDRFADIVNNYCNLHPGSILVAADCDGTRITNRVRGNLTALILPTPDTATLDCLDNKWTFYEFCVQHNLSVPATCSVPTKHALDFPAAAEKLGLPVVIKPVKEQGSKGVHIVNSVADYRRLVLEEPDYLHAPLIAQEYINGTDIGANLLAVDGHVKALAIQRRVPPQDEGAPIEFIDNAALFSSAVRLVQETGYSGVMNIDARIECGSGKVYLLESNPRFWRSLSASVWCGLNFVAELFDCDSSASEISTLHTGTADTFYHPIFRPQLCIRALLDSGQRGRLARLMMFDICTLGSSLMAFKRCGSACFTPAQARS